MQGTNPLLIYSWLLMEVWSPEKMVSESGKLFFKTRGVILHDRVMNEEWERLDKHSYQLQKQC